MHVVFGVFGKPRFVTTCVSTRIQCGTFMVMTVWALGLGLRLRFPLAPSFFFGFSIVGTTTGWTGRDGGARGFDGFW